MNEFITKPFKLTDFQKLLEAHFSVSVKDKIVSPVQSELLSEMKKKLRVLLAEDNLINQKIAMITLQKMGFHTEVVFNGQEVLDKFETSHFDIIFMDVQMPVMDGIEATQKVRELEKESKTKKPTLIFAITADPSAEELEKAIASGMNGSLPKPFRPEDVENILKDKLQEMAKAAKEEIKEPEFKLKVLVVEDNPVNQKVVSLALKKMGHEYDLAENGEEGVKKFKEKEFDAIIMDIQMPVMDGMEATKIIRDLERESEKPPIPIIALTANAMKGDKERFLAAGMDYYISKPFEVGSLREVIEDLKKKSAHVNKK